MKFLEREDAMIAQGEFNCHFWDNGSSASEARVVFDGKYVHEQMRDFRSGLRPNRPTHLMPLVNHCDEGDPKLNCKAVFMKVE